MSDTKCGASPEVERRAIERVRAACEDLAIALPDNDEPFLVTLERVMKVARQAIVDAGKANVRAGLLRQERDILQDEVAALSTAAPTAGERT